MSHHYNITISGLPGNGSTTLLRLLEEKLQPNGWKCFSGGEFMRAYAAEHGLFDDANGFHHDATVYSEVFDREVDYGMRDKLQKQEKWVLEGWLSGFLAQGVSKVLKVLLICSHDSVRIDRIVNRDEISIKQAKKHIQERTEKNMNKWRSIYAEEWNNWVVRAGKMNKEDPIDFWNPKLYDVVIDTYSHSREETRDKVLEAL